MGKEHCQNLLRIGAGNDFHGTAALSIYRILYSCRHNSGDVFLAPSQAAQMNAHDHRVSQASIARLPLLRTSERNAYNRCIQRWWWGWREGLIESGPPNDKLWFGTGWHYVMAHWYGKKGTKRGNNPLKVWRDWIGEEIPKIRVNLHGEDWKEETYLDAGKLGEAMIGAYIDRWGTDPHWDVIQVERPFEVVIVDTHGRPRVLFCGTYDGVYRDLNDDHIWLMEHKTAKQIVLAHLSMDNQAGGYFMVAARELANAKLIKPGERLFGITYNFARKALPDERPQDAQGRYLNKNGTVSKQQGSPLFQRYQVIRTTRERNSMINRIQAEVEHMNAVRTGQLPVFKNPTRDCSWDCSFYQMCLLHESGGKDWEEYRDHIYKQRDPYEDHRKSASD